MATLANEFLGIRSPNPFWLASGPPTDKEYNVRRAFEVGWGGVVWKTLGEDGPPAVNVNGPRYGVVRGADRRVVGINNIELITDRPLELNLREIKAVQSIAIREGRVFEVIDEECVACNLCVITCPVEDCITMESLPVGAIDPRTGEVVEGYANWTTHPHNPEVGGEPPLS